MVPLSLPTKVGLKTSDIKAEDVIRRFDIFLSQFQGLRQGRFGEALYQIEGAEQTLNSMSIELDDIEPTIIFLDQDDVEVRGLGEGKGKEETVDRWDSRGG